MEKSKNLVWSISTNLDLRNIYGYYSQFSTNIANKIINRIFEKASILKNTNANKIRQINEYNSNYRRLISGNYKIFYKVNTEEILVVRIFDSRQDPKKSILVE